MFGETNAFNLNSHVYRGKATGIYLSVRYSTTKKAAADMPTVVGSMLVPGGDYAFTAIVGIGVGVGSVYFLQNVKKKKKENVVEERTTDDK